MLHGRHCTDRRAREQVGAGAVADAYLGPMASTASMASALRARCSSLPAVTERLSHGAPTFFIRGRSSFVTLLLDGHHDLDFPHLICAAPAGVQASLVGADPERYFVPPYVGGRGWIGIRLDRGLPIDEVLDRCEDAYRTVAPRRLLDELDAQAE